MSLSIDQLHAFHAQDREIFSKLVLNFSRSPAESLLVMATWFWLENFGFDDIFSIIIALSDPFIAILADEATLCFQCLDSAEPPNVSNQIPLTARLMTKEISLSTIYDHRYSAIIGIKNFLSTICSRIFSDILQQVLPSSSSSPNNIRVRSPLIIPGFPHPTFGSINVMPHVVDGDNLPNNNLFLVPNGVWGWNANCIATENDRTMFLTFSRGFPVSEAEVKELFTKKYGEGCIESLYIPEDNGNTPNIRMNSSGQQSLYARLVMDSVTTVDRILQGENLKKLQINQKHIWARKYEERRPSI